MGLSSDDCGGGTGNARFERLGMRCGVTFVEPSDSGCVASSSLTAMSRLPLCPKKGRPGSIRVHAQDGQRVVLEAGAPVRMPYNEGGISAHA